MNKLKKGIIFIALIALFNIFFIDNVFAETYNNYSNAVVSCGSSVKNIPVAIPRIVSIVYTIIQIVVPILLVVFGSIDLVKGVMAQKEDEIKKGQHTFIKRIIAAAIVFFVFAVVKFVVSIAADSTDSPTMMDCIECFIKNKCDSVDENNVPGGEDAT